MNSYQQYSSDNYYEAPKVSERELLLSVFPESKQIVQDLIAELEDHRVRLAKQIVFGNITINAESSDETYRYFWKSWHLTPPREELKEVQQKLARLRRQLRLITNAPLPDGALNGDLIASAKAIPIESIFDQKLRKTGNMLTGKCPFNDERTASFFVYKNSNRCWCFGCQQGGNTIDTYMMINNCDFKQAVLELNGVERG